MATDLPSPPKIALAVAQDLTSGARATGGFLNVQRLSLVAHYPDGTQSAPFAYDIAVRESLDVAVICAHFTKNGVRRVFLRSSVRPPVALRGASHPHDGLLWELPAGLIDAGETPAQAAARELEEELGVRCAPSQLQPLGGWTLPVAGMCAERHEFFHVEVDPAARFTPTEDGSPLERAAAIIDVPLTDAIAHCRAGAIRDAKTELALRRLAELGERP